MDIIKHLDAKINSEFTALTKYIIFLLKQDEDYPLIAYKIIDKVYFRAHEFECTLCEELDVPYREHQECTEFESDEELDEQLKDGSFFTDELDQKLHGEGCKRVKKT